MANVQYYDVILKPVITEKSMNAMSEKKYTFLVYHKQYLDFLERIKDIGVLHVIEKPEGITENDALREKMHLASRVKHVLKQLERLRPKDAALSPADPHRNGLDVLARVEEVLHEQEHLQQQLALTGKERDRMEVWGRFSHKRIAELEQAGILLTFFSCPTRKFDPEWETTYHTFEIDQQGSTLYFVTVTRPGETVDIDADRITLSDRTAEEWIDELVRLQEALDRCRTRLERMAVADYNTLKETEVDALTEVSFNKVLLNTLHEADDKVMLLEGWVPEEAVAPLNAYLDSTDIYYEANDPVPGERVPIKLKNNRFARLFEFIGELYDLPNYWERDLTAFFAPFYVIFFGLCLGDVGYGLLLLVAGLVARKKLREPAMRSVMSLIAVLGGGATSAAPASVSRWPSPTPRGCNASRASCSTRTNCSTTPSSWVWYKSCSAWSSSGWAKCNAGASSHHSPRWAGCWCSSGVAARWPCPRSASSPPKRANGCTSSSAVWAVLASSY